MADLRVVPAGKDEKGARTIVLCLTGQTIGWIHWDSFSPCGDWYFTPNAQTTKFSSDLLLAVYEAVRDEPGPAGG